MVNALYLLLALDRGLGWSDIQLDSAGIPDYGTNNMFPWNEANSGKSEEFQIKWKVMWIFESEDHFSLFQHNILSSKV